MNGQGSTSNSFPVTFHVDHGPNVNNLGFVQNNVVPTNSAVHFSPTVIGWMGQSSSSVNTHNQINPQELLGWHGWLSSIGSPDGTGQRFEVSHSEPNIAPFQERANVIPIEGQVTNGTSILQGSSYGARYQNIDLNALHESSNSDANQDMGAGLSLRLFKPDGLEANQNPPASNSSIPIMISSGLAGYVLEENDGREGLSSDGRRVSCKRRAPEDAPRLLYLGESSSSGQESGNSEWRAVAAQKNANSSLNISTPLSIPPHVSHPNQLEDRIGVGRTGAVSSMHQSSSGAGQAECSQRNIRLRRAPNPQDFVPPSMLPSGNTRNSYLQSPIQPTMFSPFDHFPNSSSAATLPVNGTPPVQAFAHVPNSLQNLQPSPWYDLTRSRAGGSSNPPDHAVTGGNTLQHEQNSRNTLLVPETEGVNVAQYPTTFSFFNGNSNSPGNIASSSQNGTLSGVHFTSAPIRVPERNMPEQYGQRFSDIVNGSTTASSAFECRGLGGDCPLHSRTSAAAREMDLSVRGGVVRPFQVYQMSGWMTSPERQVGGNPENPFSESIGATQRTSRLISEVRNAVAFVRRGGNLLLEDVMVIDRSVLYGVSEEDDMHEDMRLDVDNMSYEELLALGEHIGDVCVGLSAEAILANLRQQKYESLTLGSPVEDESCCICQEEYVNGDDLGKLDCGHDFHFTCIKQWLVQKNSCPICKMKALAVRDGGN